MDRFYLEEHEFSELCLIHGRPSVLRAICELFDETLGAYPSPSPKWAALIEERLRGKVKHMEIQEDEKSA